MRDLTSRLREIVKTDLSKRSRGPEVGSDVSRALRYESNLAAPPADAAAVARLLGGQLHGPSCVTIDRVWDPYQWHGRLRVESCVLDRMAPIGLFDPRATKEEDWWSRVVFFDLETTGLSGGAGTLPFLAGCGWFEDGAFRVRQFFLTGPAGEHAMLDGLAAIFDDASLLVTYNGRTFDVPLMETRWAYHRRDCATDDLAHFDMLPTARRLWARRDEESGCSLGALERAILRFHRLSDVPGFEIPSRYFQFLRTGDPAAIAGVLSHNQHDLISLAGVLAHALRLVAEGPDACETAGEQLGLGRLYERAEDLGRAAAAYERAAASDDDEIAVHALAGLAVLMRREGRYDASADAWRRILARAPAGRPHGVLERRAVEALAIHHEHRARDLGSARQYAQSLRSAATGRLAAQADHRLTRLNRKIVREEEKGGPKAAWLLENPPGERG